MQYTKTSSPVPADCDALLTLFHSQQSELSNLHQFVEQLLEQIRLSRHQHYGARSEKFSIDQLSLLADEAATASRDADADEGAARTGKENSNDSILVPAG